MAQQSQGGVCPHCRGMKTVIVQGQTLVCPKCGGSGKAGVRTK